MVEFFDEEKVKELVNELEKENKLSVIYKENPKMILLHLPAGYEGEDEVHENEDDICIVLDGEAELVVAEKLFHIIRGNVIHIPAKITHKLKRTGKGITYLVVKRENEDIQ